MTLNFKLTGAAVLLLSLTLTGCGPSGGTQSLPPPQGEAQMDPEGGP